MRGLNRLPIVFHPGNRGSTTLFIAAVILPLLLFLFSMGLDVRSYLNMRDNAQRLLDQAGLYAYHFLNAAQKNDSLNGRDYAVEMARSFLSRYESVGPFTTISRNGDMLLLEFKGKCPFFFGTFVSRILGASFAHSDDAGDTMLYIPVTARSKVRGTVFDSVIAVDRSYYVAPSLYASASQAWGDADIWLASPLFDSAFPVSFANQSSVVDNRIATQQCFNPFFSAIKAAAINAYEALQSFELNDTAIVFFPGGYESSTIVKKIRRIRGRPEADFFEAVLFSMDDGDKVINDEVVPIDGVSASRSAVENRHCAAIAESTDSPRHYWFPERSRFSDNPLAGKPRMISQDNWSYNSLVYDSELTAAEVIWSRAAVSHPRYVKEPDIPKLIEDLLPVLFESGSNTARGGLKNRAVRNILIFAGDLPRQKGVRFGDSNDAALRISLQQAFARYRSILGTWNHASIRQGDPAGVSIHYVLFNSTASPYTVSAERISALNDFFKEQSLITDQDNSYLKVQLFYMTSLSAFENGVLQALLLKGKSGVLSW